jgi:CubicO group peptidase (beta-lactamase class C family)
MTDAFDAVADLFTQQQATGAFPGGQLVVMRDGERLCDVAVGVARGLRGEEPLSGVSSETRFQVMSASKPFVALAVALLEDDGRLEVEAPVARYFPEFARHDKGSISVLEVLTHRSGVLLENVANEPEMWPDWHAVVEGMVEARPRFARGTLAYSPAGFGWILAEVVQRITGQSLQDFLLGRLPPAVAGVRFLDPTQMDSVAYSYWQGPDSLMLAGRNIAADFEAINNRLTCAEACVPGAGLLANARELAAFYDLLVAPEPQIISARTLQRYITKQTFGFERQLKLPLTLGRGFALGSLGPHAYGWWNTGPCFGHAGGFGVIAFADPRTRVATAIVTNGHRGIGDMIRRFAPLGTRIRRAALAR